MRSETLERASLITGYWYDRMAASGREALLFGSPAREQCIRAVRRTLSEGAFFGLYSEFPLLGEPFLDLSVSGSGGAEGFAEGDGFGYAPLFSYSHSVGIDSLGFEYDLSTGGENAPRAVMFLPRGMDGSEYIKNCLTLMGLGDRSERVLRYIHDAPWEFSYFGGLLNGRDRPVRIVFRLRERELSLIRADMGRFLSELSNFGYDGGELSGMPLLAKKAEVLSVGFDVMPDGRLSSSLGCEYGMARHGGDFLPDRFLQGVNAEVFSTLEEKGCIDSRWREAAKSAFACILTLPDGERVLAKHAVHTVKLRWKNGAPATPKMYTQFVCGRFAER